MEYITLSGAFVPAGAQEGRRVGLATKSTPGRHAAPNIADWLKTTTTELFAGFMGDDVKPNKVYLAITADQGGNVHNALQSLGIEPIVCCAHRLNTGVVWSLGIGGSTSTRLNKPMEKIIKRIAACVRIFSHSAVNNNERHRFQEMEDELSCCLELVRRNDTG